MAVQVSLDTTANPPVTVNPRVHDVNQGNQTIKWERASNQTFTFSSLTGLPTPPFGTPTVSDSEITVTDNNTSAAAYGYTIVVTYGGQQYGTAPSRPNPREQNNNGPVINNK
ncbi:MAG TPA: hypothetical protein VFK08_01845 [Rhodanobacteraceae bacterium]|nr:hypothetical protein [Rhodanobacteraceae bacterium]